MIYIETERLILRDWQELDTEPFRAMNKDPMVMEFFPNVLTDKESDAFSVRIKDEFKEYGYGLYAVETKNSQELIGFVGFHRAVFQSAFTPCIEIGWRLKTDAWGKGYATECAKACLRYGLESLGLERVSSFTSQINTRSENVMKKIGLKKIREFDHPNIDDSSKLKPHVLYSISKEDWMTKAGH